MSVLLQTSFGDMTMDLNTEKCPVASKNFIKLCKLKHYNNSLFINIQKNYIAQLKTKNPTTIYRQVYQQEDYKYFQDEVDLQLKLNKIGLVCTSNLGPNLNNSQFFITLTKDNLTYLNGKHTVFGKIVEGFEVLQKINQSFTDEKGRPYMNIRIIHTHIIDDPFQDLANMKTSYPSPILQMDPQRLQAIEHLQMIQKGKTKQDIQKATREQKAKKQAVTLEILGDMPDADAKPPQNVLFVCKLNPVTQQRDLQLIFSRYGPVKSCEIVRDWKTGQSLQYGFIQYQNPASCQQAYLKMQNVLIDDRRIHVDFCQSVTKLWPKSNKKGGIIMNSSKKNGNLMQSKDGKRNKELVPKYKEGLQYYGQRSNKYDIVISKKNKKRQEEYQIQQRKQIQMQQDRKDYMKIIHRQKQQQKVASQKEHKQEKKKKKDRDSQQRKKKKKDKNKQRSRSRQHKKKHKKEKYDRSNSDSSDRSRNKKSKKH